MDYNDFLLRISPAPEPGRFVVTAKSATAGEASGTFVSPFSETELENFVLKIGLTRRGVRKIQSPEWRAAQSFGQKLYSTLFADDIRATYLASRNDALREGKGLRVKVIVDAPTLANYPWEFLYDSSLNRFLSLYAGTPVVRYVELSTPPQVLRVAPPLRILVLASSPSDYPSLDLARERNNLDSALSELVEQNQIAVDWLPNANLEGLRAQLIKRAYHIFHFIGHGGFDDAAQDGVLVLEDESKRSRPVSGERLAVLLGNHPTLRLAILNSCEGARTSAQDPFAGAAMTLVKSGGLAAVVAMQFEITDQASIAFSRGLYSSLAAGNPVDAAVTEARLAIFAEDNDVEWGTPVLYLRAPDGVIFAPLSPEEIADLQRKWAEQERREQERKEAERLAQEKAQAERAAREQAEKERLAREREETERLAQEKTEAERLAREQAERERAAKVAELYRAAQQSFAQRNYSDALQSLESLLALDATHTAALDLMSKAQAAQAEQERLAKEKAERAAQAQAEQERLAKEKAERDRAAQIANLLRVAEKNFAQKKYREAAETAQKILALDANHVRAQELVHESQQHLNQAAIAPTVLPRTAAQPSAKWRAWAWSHKIFLAIVGALLFVVLSCYACVSNLGLVPPLIRPAGFLWEDSVFSPSAVAFSPDGKLLATANSYDKTAFLYQVAQHTRIQTLKGHLANVNGVAFSPDGKQLATAGADRAFIVWDVATGKQIKLVSDPALGDIQAIAWNATGAYIATYNTDGVVQVWDTATWSKRYDFTAKPVQYHYGIAFNTDGTLLAANGDDGEQIWYMSDGTRLPKSSQRSVYDVAWSLRDPNLFATAFTSSISIWHLGQKDPHKTLNGACCVDHVSFSADGTLLMANGDRLPISFWRTSDWQLVYQLNVGGSVNQGALSPDNKLLAVAQSGPRSVVSLWQLPATLQNLPTPTRVAAAVQTTTLSTPTTVPTQPVIPSTVANAHTNTPVPPTATAIPTKIPVPPTPTLGPTPLGGVGRIAFNSNRDGDYEIYVMNADGTALMPLTNNSADDEEPAWSPDGKRIAFVSDRDGNAEIYVMNADGSGQMRLTNNSADDFEPAWSPDGKRIAFNSNRDGNHEIYVMNADGSGQRRLTNDSADDDWPAWSPDGKWIAFYSSRDGNGEIYIMNADGSGLTRLTNNQADDDIPSWSPDGKRIAFASNRNDLNPLTCGRKCSYEIYVMNADGSMQTRLTNNSAKDLRPVWSPDGRRIAFHSDRVEPDPLTCGEKCSYEIFVMNADGSMQTRLTNNPADDEYPSWQPSEK